MTTPDFLLDTCVCIRLLRGGGAPVARRIAAAEPGAIAISVISLAELMEGAGQGSAALDSLLETIPVLGFDVEAARAFPAARPARGRHDRLIAAHALALSATLVTHNGRDFRAVPGLRIEDWF
ncbi:type II toxin-antitoxin system VapC family toxin [Sphingomonas sp. ABOLD]|uniref:Ribonuclease VapC n=1 Tax=Sphingomonas trueperi TaxID=53317 RepID=A0A7X5XX83_9SPHN|nr:MULTISPECIES: type II toxin-antitoxin system VapC family toxin [Sphingomonas]NJB97016.1 tRNA(fMet)-specific endonuclease VapC [Sphingomonas trueperi]RSV50808.1 type II toxin-antitoxin system VapC family toxin [Sphingomonas sp. ABOLD]